MKIACVLGQGFEDSEFRVPYDRLKEEGYQIDIIGVDAGEQLNGYQGRETVKAEKGIDQVGPDDYDGLSFRAGSRPTTCGATRAWSRSSKPSRAQGS